MARSNQQTSLHDIAFEGRNKSYGAYVLRVTSDRRTGLSLLLGILFFLAVLALFYLGIWLLRKNEPVYMMPSVSVGLDNTLPSIFSPPLGIEQSVSGKTKIDKDSKTEDTPVAKDKVIPDKLDEAAGANQETGNSSGTGTVTHAGSQSTGAGIPWGTGEVFLVADVIPQFEGGREGLSKYLKKNIRYPEKAIDQQLQGTVLVCFVVTSEGSVKDVKVVKSIHPLLDDEAIRVVSTMPLWKPGLRAGRPVNIVLTLPIRFDLHLHFSS